MFVTRNKARSVYPEDISCICDPVDGKGGIFVSNLEAAENINTLKRKLWPT